MKNNTKKRDKRTDTMPSAATIALCIADSGQTASSGMANPLALKKQRWPAIGLISHSRRKNVFERKMEGKT